MHIIRVLTSHSPLLALARQYCSTGEEVSYLPLTYSIDPYNTNRYSFMFICIIRDVTSSNCSTFPSCGLHKLTCTRSISYDTRPFISAQTHSKPSLFLLLIHMICSLPNCYSHLSTLNLVESPTHPNHYTNSCLQMTTQIFN